MKWRKRGLVYVPQGDMPWARGYATFPTADLRDEGVLRIYFTSLDDQKIGRTGYIDLDPENPSKILEVGKEPVLQTGPAGQFDDSGANAFCVVNTAQGKSMYYQGWQRSDKVPYLVFTGLAVSDKAGKVFSKQGRRVPVLDRTDDEPFMRAAPFVLHEDCIFKMWYASCTEWTEDAYGQHYSVGIRYATSTDGIAWAAHKHYCLPPLGKEYGVGRPSVVRDGNLYRMWYSIRSLDTPYRIGYAESEEGIAWERKDDASGIVRSESGWDSEMICYPYVIDVNKKRYMFYNGNRHGSSGFGFAEME